MNQVKRFGFVPATNQVMHVVGKWKSDLFFQRSVGIFVDIIAGDSNQIIRFPLPESTRGVTTTLVTISRMCLH